MTETPKTNNYSIYKFKRRNFQNMKMPKRFFLYTALGIAILFGSCNVMVTSQPGGMDFNSLLNQMSWDEKANMLKSFLLADTNHTLFKELQHILVAALPILTFDGPQEVFQKDALPWALDTLPLLLENKLFLKVVKIFIQELNRPGIKPEYKLNSGNQTLDRQYFMAKLLADLDYIGMAEHILATPEVLFAFNKAYLQVMNNVPELIPYESTDQQLNGKCYNNTMAMLGGLLAGQDWAVDMLDAVGKPTAGIKKGVLYFIGNYDQCMSTRVRINVPSHAHHDPVNASLVSVNVSDEADGEENDVTFNGRYCRATFNLPRSLIKSVAGKHADNTYGIPLTLSWGMCLPDSCHAEDINGLLNLGLLGSLFNISVEDAVCTEDLNYKKDGPAIAITSVLGGIGLIVLVCSVVELVCLKRTNKRKPEQDAYAISGIPYMNQAYDDNYESGEMKSNGGIPQEVTQVSTAETDRSEMKTRKPDVLANSKTDVSENFSVDSDRTEDALAIDKEQNEGVCSKAIRGFSIFTNAPAVLCTKTKDEAISCIYGLRFFSMLWVMLGNTYIYAALSLSDAPVAVNLMDSFDIMKRFTFQVVLSTTFATDTFFVISGCLTAYWYLLRVDRSTSKVNIKTWLKFYAGRYWKMTPPYMLVLATQAFLYIYLGNGPVWPKSINVAESCHTDWWKNLLYVNNLVGVDGVSAENQCMAWSWYLAVNMQFYLIAPILLTFLSFSNSMGMVLLLIVSAAGIVSAGVKENIYGGDILTSRTDNGAYWNNVFTKPWCRVAAFCIGMALGFVLKHWFHKKMKKILAAALWLLFICLAVLVVYCTYSKYVDDIRPWNSAEMAAYEALSRPVWSLCVAWVIYACSSELAGPISDFLSWKGFVPLSRLTFMVYLIHPVLMVLTVYSRRSLIYITDFDMAYLFIGHVVVSYCVAFIATLLYDMPFRNIKRILNGKTLQNQL